jgi:glycoside/pentoside/hexuronide:cation symporter, GPH family
METGIKKLSIREKIGYSLGDGAANFFFQTIMMYQVVYFTDVLKLPGSQARTLFLVALFWNAIFDPFMGRIADKTKTRWGKFRPWILWSSVPFGVLFYLTFLTPELQEGAKLVYAYVTYILMMTIYSVNNTPYSALSGVLTGDTKERTGIASYRQVTAMACSFVIQGFLLTIKNHFAVGHDQAYGWRTAIGIFAAVAILFHLITFLSTKERIVPAKEDEAKFSDSVKDLFRNRSWIVLFLATFFIFTTLCLRGNMIYMYFTSYLDAASVQEFLSKLGYRTLPNPGEKCMELFNMIGMSFTILGIILSKPLSVRFGKKLVFVVGLALAACFNALIYIASSDEPARAIIINIFQSLCYGVTIPLLWSMLGDVADFAVWKFMRRSTGLVFAGVSFALKMGLGIGLALATLVKDIFKIEGVDAYNTEGFRLGASVYPAILFGLGVVFLIFYTISPKMEQQIQNELEARRKAHA